MQEEGDGRALADTRYVTRQCYTRVTRHNHIKHKYYCKGVCVLITSRDLGMGCCLDNSCDGSTRACHCLPPPPPLPPARKTPPPRPPLSKLSFACSRWKWNGAPGSSAHSWHSTFRPAPALASTA